jgi:hypothetical protein
MDCRTLGLQLDRIRRLAPHDRVFSVGRELLTSRQHQDTNRHMAAFVVQMAWRRYRHMQQVSVAGTPRTPRR